MRTKGFTLIELMIVVLISGLSAYFISGMLVNFAKTRDADEVLNEWSADMKSLLGLLERIDHLITKEEMMARITPSQKVH